MTNQIFQRLILMFLALVVTTLNPYLPSSAAVALTSQQVELPIKIETKRASTKYRNESKPAFKTAYKKPKRAKRTSRKVSKKAARIAKEEDDDDQVKFVALTFDDGPSPVYTPKILEILKNEGIHATFFVIGREAKKYPDIVQQIVEEGHTIGDHSMNHDEQLYKRSDAKMQSEILGTKTLIQSIVPEASIEYYRAPAGNINRHQRGLVAEWGMKPINWSVDTKDWQRPGVKVILANLKKQLHNGGIILMHDSGGNRSETVAALKKLIPKLKKKGYQFVSPNAALAARQTHVIVAAK